MKISPFLLGIVNLKHYLRGLNKKYDIMENLTKVQQKLIDDLVKEFTKINPKPKTENSRFGVSTIMECLKEEERFKETITKHNTAIVGLLSEQIQNEVDGFKKEFGKVIDIQVGIESNHVTHTLSDIVKYVNENPLMVGDSSEATIFFVSKTKKYHDDSRYDYFDGKKYNKFYVYFKREWVTITLESGKRVSVYKIVGVEYCTVSWLERNKDYSFKTLTLDEMIQTNKTVQQKLTELVS
jgi:hypothetical protein